MKNKTVLILGDILAIAVVTIIGFTMHGEANTSFLPRMVTAFIPLTLSWFLLAPWFGLFDPETASDFKQLWRPALVMIFAGPLAVVLRGLILNASIIPIFGVVLSTTSAFGMVIWRAIYSIINRKVR